MEICNNDGLAKVIAYYLPQYYPCEFNNKWYGAGFTEWTNVGKAKPLYKGHNQPRVPSELGYYDLRVPEVAEKQAELARAAGVFGFAYWHYWWAGKRLLDMPAERMLHTGKPDFPFMFAWANENWFKKQWDKDLRKDVLIMEQTYPGEEDNLEHFNYCLHFFKDKRYITHEGKPIFLIYHPLNFPKVNEFMQQWNDLIKKNGVADSFYWMAISKNSEDEYQRLLNLGFDCINFMIGNARIGNVNEENKFKYALWLWKQRFNRHILHKPSLIDYKKIIENIWQEKYDSQENVAPVIIPQWDHSPRSGIKAAEIYENATPINFEILSKKVFEKIKPKKNKIVMMKSWNEWGEGNYMEPDLTYGRGFIEALDRAIKATKETL